MSSNDPLSDDVVSDEQRLQDLHDLRERGLVGVTPEEADDLLDDIRGDKIGGEYEDDGNNLSDVVPGPELDGND